MDKEYIEFLYKKIEEYNKLTKELERRIVYYNTKIDNIKRIIKRERGERE